MRYPHVQKDAFDIAWKKLSGSITDIYKTHYGAEFQSAWSTEISHLMALLKMLPAKASGKNMSSIESSFAKAEQRLIVFREVKYPLIAFIMNSVYEFVIFRKMLH